MRRIPALDGLRGIAILLVLAVHCTGYPPGGHLGVDLFFVLSGFLITTMLLDERTQNGGISLRAFYARRARRLLPALAILLAAYLIIDAAKGHNGLERALLGGLYFGNAVQAFGGGHLLVRSGIEHLWTLAEEEQFYLLWPLLLPFVATRRRPVRLLAVTIAVLICYRFVLAFGGATHGRLYNGPDTHADGLIAGAALAFFLRHRPGFALRGTLALAGASVGVWALIVRQPTQAWDVFGLPLAEAACVLVVLAALTLPGWSKILSVPPLRWFGRISYSLYLWHYMLIWAFGFHNRAIPGVLAVGVAYVSTRWVEEPIRQWRRPAREAGAVVAAAQTSVA